MAKPVPMVRPRSANAIEAVAHQVLLKHGVATLEGREPFNVMKFVDGPLEDICTIAFEVQDLGPSIEGRFEDRTLILNTEVYQGVLRGRPRDRFTTAHECGHAILHADELDVINEWSRGSVALYRKGEIPAYRNPEWQANYFASALLMPISGVRAVIDRSAFKGANFITEALMSKFNVSAQSASIRISTLQKRGIIGS